jgi:type IV pilus assembly protein PilA
MIIIGILAAIAIPTFLAQRERAWEAAARSDLRNAAAAATSCAADNGGSYVNCSTLVQLQAFGFNPSDSVTYTPVAATATRWEATTKHANAAQVFRFSTDGANAGRVTP